MGFGSLGGLGFFGLQSLWARVFLDWGLFLGGGLFGFRSFWVRVVLGFSFFKVLLG